MDKITQQDVRRIPLETAAREVAYCQSRVDSYRRGLAGARAQLNRSLLVLRLKVGK